MYIFYSNKSHLWSGEPDQLRELFNISETFGWVYVICLFSIKVRFFLIHNCQTWFWANFLPESGSSSRQMKTFPFMLPPLVRFTKPPWIWPLVWSLLYWGKLSFWRQSEWFWRRIIILTPISILNYEFGGSCSLLPQWGHFQLLGAQVQSLSLCPKDSF